MRWLIHSLWSLAVLAAADSAPTPRLPASNLAAPFCYEHGGTRRWPVFSSPLPAGVNATLSAWRNDKELARGTRLEFSGLAVSLSRDGWLEIQSLAESEPVAFTVEIRLESSGVAETQKLTVRAAPPARPISYLADFGDDLLDLFMDRTRGRWRPLEKGVLDQYFRRLQAHGVRRLIVWQSPFPYMADAQNYAAADWQNHTEQARAIIDSPELTTILEKRCVYVSWAYLRGLMAMRLTPQLGELLTRSAREHGIALTASFRPFEMALDKYYAVPAFDEIGTFLWDYHPLASPTVNYHTDQVGFAHYRKVLAVMDRADAGQLHTIVIKNVKNADAFVRRFSAQHDNLRLVASPFPPLQEDGFVLVRGKDARFQLRPFSEIQTKAEAQCRELKNLKVERDGQGTVTISGIEMPDDCRYLLLSDPSALDESLDFPTHESPTLRAKAGNELGRANVYWAAAVGDASGKKTRVAGITAEGEFCANFNAVEASAAAAQNGPPRLSLLRDQLVIDLGEAWSVEMVDFNQPAARRNAVNELRSILSHPPFDEIFINTRSHTQLAATLGDGKDGLKPLSVYRLTKESYAHLGIDRAYAPRDAASDPKLRDIADVERITNWQPGEWNDTCQSPDSPFVWRYARNRGVADGVRKLLADFEQAFPQTRIRVVMPEREAATKRIKAALDQMSKPGGGVYGRDYYRQLTASINHIPAIGEGMAMVGLNGLRTEPVFLGIRMLPEMEPFKLYVRECIADMADNHGSSFRGPRSYFYEGHETLRTTDKDLGRRGREERICHLLEQHADINEVILYEAAAWVQMPRSDADLCGHGFLDRRAPTTGANSRR